MTVGPATTSDFAKLRVWLIHDWLTGMRGGEKVLRELVGVFPQARIATLFMVPGMVDPELQRRVARTSFLQRVPRIDRAYRHLLPLMPAAIRGLTLDPCDLVISSSHCVAKAVHVPAGAVHICYCHTPMRYIWGMETQYLGATWSLRRAALGLVKRPLQRFDLASNQGVDGFVANSRHVADRIRDCYARDAEVVHPGIDEKFYIPAAELQEAGEPFYLLVTALVGYKRVDLAVQAFADSKRRLVIIGRGPEEAPLRRLAAGYDNIEFLGWQSDESVRWHYQHCRALLFPGQEDFGLVPLEAMACGRPVIAYGVGGATETVTPSTGVLFGTQSVSALREALAQFEATATQFVPAQIRTHALTFTWTHFCAGMAAVVRRHMAGGSAGDGIQGAGKTFAR